MSEEKIVVPEGMLEATRGACTPNHPNRTRIELEAALRWLTENPIVPTEPFVAMIDSEVRDRSTRKGYGMYVELLAEWRRMFLAPEPIAHTIPPPSLCGAVVISFIAGASWFPCALSAGHVGGHRAAGNCFKHGYYLGEEGSVPHCPKWPECVEMLTDKTTQVRAPEPEVPEAIKDLLSES